MTNKPAAPIVKSLDENPPAPLDHVGVWLWRAATGFRDRLHREMVDRGHTFYGDARAAVAAHLDPGGTSQSELARRMGSTKQAVQQLLDALEADGIVRREVDPEDRRSKRVVYTEAGLRAVRDANAIKRRIEADYRAVLGDRGFEALRAALEKLARAR